MGDIVAIELSKRFASNIPDAELQSAVCQGVQAMTHAAKEIAHLCAFGPLAGALGAVTGDANADGDEQKALDVRSDVIIQRHLKDAPVAYYASEEEDVIRELDPDKMLAIACDPLDGSSNIDTNISVGTIFSMYQAVPGSKEQSFFRSGEEQLVGGFFVYGPQTSFFITAGDGTEQYVMDPETGVFKLVNPEVRIAVDKPEYAINSSNFRHWGRPVRSFIEDCKRGKDGQLGKEYNMRWVGSLVAEASRILSRGGCFVYPEDARPGYEKGRLRQLYECNPVSFIIEQAGGGAIDGHARILEREVTELHQRIPFTFGSKEQVRIFSRYHDRPGFLGSRAQLFRPRGLFHQ